MPEIVILQPDFYNRKTEVVAAELLGKIIVVQTLEGPRLSRIVETEAYLGIQDPACHTYKGRRTPRVESMYLTGGHSYVYLIYGMYHCLNFVTKSDRDPEAVLIRAVEPLDFKYTNKKDLPTNGPGKLCRYYAITKADDGLPLWKKSSRIFVKDDGQKLISKEIIKTSRIGIDYAGEASSWPLRFYIKDNILVSKK